MFNRASQLSVDDIAFLNDFLNWYLRPLISDELTEDQLYSLGSNGLPREMFQIDGVSELSMKYFIDEGKPITQFVDYLGLID